MTDMLEAEIWGIARAGDGSMVFLKPVDVDFAVPIFIGQLEAQAILIGYGNVDVPRPLTPDLLLSVIRHAGFVLVRVEISEIKDNTFFARLVLCSAEKSAYTAEAPLAVDARPSDALALAVRSKCPIYLAEQVIDEAGIPAENIVENDIDADEAEARYTSLQEEMEAAVTAENYERAAEIRDILKKLDQEGSGVKHFP
jgi:bifunctional DNase/RNase